MPDYDDLFPPVVRRPAELDVQPIEDQLANAKPTTYVVENLIPERSFLIIAGPPKKARKTFTAMHLALCVGRGASFLGFRTFARPVYYVFLEDGEPRAARRWFQLGARPDAIPRSNVHNSFQLASLPGLLEKIQQQKCLLIIDTLSVLAMHSGVDDENSSLQMTAFLTPFQNAVRSCKTGSSIIMIHHHAKHNATMRGSTALNAVPDGWIDITVASKETRKMSFTVRDLEEDVELMTRMVTDQHGNLTFVRDLSPPNSEVDSVLDRYVTQIEMLVASNPKENYWEMRQFAAQIGVAASNDSLRKAVNRLVADGFLTKSGAGRAVGYRPRAGLGVDTAAGSGAGSGAGDGNSNGNGAGLPDRDVIGF